MAEPGEGACGAAAPAGAEEKWTVQVKGGKKRAKKPKGMKASEWKENQGNEAGAPSKPSGKSAGERLTYKK